MTNRILLLMLMVIALFPIDSAYAQDHMPPVLDPSAVFADAVKVIEARDVLNIDEVGKALYFHAADASSWQMVSLPADFPRTAHTLRRSDGTYLIGAGYAEFLERQPADKLWLFDPRIGALTRPPEYICGVVRAPPNEGRWILHAEADHAPYYFCHTETGQLSPALPTRKAPMFCASDYDTFGTYQTTISPDDRYVVGSVCQAIEDLTIIVRLYAYDLTTQAITSLGTLRLTATSTSFGNMDWTLVERWADATHPIISLNVNRSRYSRYSPIPSNISSNTIRELLVANVSQANSLTTIIKTDTNLGYNEQLTIYDEQQHSYVWITPNDCRVHQYALATLQTSDKEPIPNVCGLGIPINDGSGDRLYASPDTNAPTQLIRFDLSTRESIALYSDELLTVVDTSPDGRYAQLSAGDFSKLPQQNGWTGYSGKDDEHAARLVILDLHIRQVIGTWHYYISDPMVAPTMAPMLAWIDETTFRLSGGTIYETSLLRISEGKLTSVRYPGNDNLNDLDYLFFIQQPQLVNAPDADHLLGVTDPAKRRIIPLVRKLHDFCCIDGEAVMYRVEGRPQPDGTILVSLYYVAKNRKFVVSEWLIRV